MKQRQRKLVRPATVAALGQEGRQGNIPHRQHRHGTDLHAIPRVQPGAASHGGPPVHRHRQFRPAQGRQFRHRRDRPRRRLGRQVQPPRPAVCIGQGADLIRTVASRSCASKLNLPASLQYRLPRGTRNTRKSGGKIAFASRPSSLRGLSLGLAANAKAITSRFHSFAKKNAKALTSRFHSFSSVLRRAN